MTASGYGGRNNQFCGRGNRDGGRFIAHGGRNGYRNLVHCQICYKTGHDASYCYYRNTQDPYGGPPFSGNFIAPQSNVWTQPGYMALNYVYLASPRPGNPPMQP